MRIAAGICSLLLSIQVLGQPASVMDSLKANIDKYPAEDTMRVRAIFQYLRFTLYNSTNNKPYLREMLALSRKLNYRAGERKALMMHVKYYGDRSDFQQSFAYADSLRQLLDGDSSYIARRDRGILYWDMGNNYHKLADYGKSLESYLLAVKVFERSGDQNFLCTLYSNISSVYENTSDTVRSLEYITKALKAAEASNDEDVLCFATINYATELINRKQFEGASRALDEAEPLVAKLENDSYSQHYSYGRGLVASNLKNYSDAVSFFRKSMRFAKTLDDVHLATEVMIHLSKSLSGMNRFPEAKVYLDSAVLLAKGAGLNTRRKHAYDGLAAWYEKDGDMKNALSYLRKSIALNDSILSEEKNKQIAALEMRYQAEARENEIRNLKTEHQLQELSIRQKNLFNYLLIGATLTILAMFLLTYKNYTHKQRLQAQRISELETEKRLAATEAVLMGEEQERTRLAKDLHDGLGGMLAGIKHSFSTMKGNLSMTPENQQAFERSMDMLDSSIREMRRVAHNMMPEALVTFGLDTALKDYCSSINQSGALQVSYQSIGIEGETIDKTISITVYRIVQELITNTMKHASASNAIVQVTRTDGLISVTVEDDGKGFDVGMLNNAKGIGWANIQHRVDFLNGKIDVRSGSGKGTSVHIEFAN